MRGDIGEAFEFGIAGRQLFDQHPAFVLQRPMLDRGRNGLVQQAGRDVGLDQIVLGAGLDRLNGDVLIALAGHHDDGQEGIVDDHLAQKLKPVASGQRIVEQHAGRR